MKKIQALVYYSDNQKHIPTRGLPTSVLDMYRTAKLIREDNSPINEGIIFHEDYNDIAIFEDEINSFDDILKFESMLRFILLKDHLSILEPAVRYSIKQENNNFDSYFRIPKYAKQSADSIFQNANAFNNLLPIEKIIIEKNKVVESTNEKSIYLNLNQDQIENQILIDKLSNDFLHTIPTSLSIPFIYSKGTESKDHNAIFNEFLESLDDNYIKQTEFLVKLGYDIQLPFFTNAVLSIAKSRDTIPDAIIELRGVIQPLRNKLFGYENEFRGISSTRELSLLQQDIKEAIKSYTKKIYEPGNLLSDSIGLIVSLATSPNEYLGKIFNPKYSLENDFPVLFGNSNYKRLRKIVEKDNVSTNLEYFLTKEEMKKIYTPNTV
jgi:hypothetical protein